MSFKTLGLRGNRLEVKRISVSKKRQITIPQKFFDKLHIGEEVECIMTDSEIIIRPVHQETEFAEEILKDLIAKGLQGEQLLHEFRKIKSNIRPAVKKMLDEAETVAQGIIKSGDGIMADIFSEDE